MNIKDFLIDNYIWILVVILITIVTIIGFIADKKKNGNKKENIPTPMPNNQNGGSQPINNQGPMQYQNGTLAPQMNNNPMNYDSNIQNNNAINQMNTNMMNTPNDINNNFNNNLNNNFNANFNQNNNFNNNIGMNPGNMNQLNSVNSMEESQSINIETPFNNMQTMGTIPQPINQIPNNFEMMNNMQPIENEPKKEEMPSYQPLSEQKPTFTPKEVPNFASTTNEMNQPNMMTQPEFPTSNIISPPIQPMNGQPQFEQISQPLPLQTNNNIMQNSQNNNFGMNSNFMPNNNTIPQPVNMVSTPQPVNPQPIMNTNGYNQPNMMSQPQPNYSQPNQNMGPSQQNASPLPVNFVFGPQNNNQNM